MGGITTAMVLAAGLGTRLRPLTDHTPKPLVNVGGEPVIVRSLRALRDAGIARAVINTHYLAPVLEDAVRAHTRGWDMQVMFSREEKLLETGGGIKKALPLLGEKPFLVVNSDAVWDDFHEPLLRPLMRAFDAHKHDVLMAVVPTKTMAAFRAEGGDFWLDARSGKLSRPEKRDKWNVVYTGVHVTHPSFIAFEAAERFSLVKPWMEAMAAGRLHGYRYKGIMMDMGSHTGLQHARNWLEKQRL